MIENMKSFNDWETWKKHVSNAIFAASIARQVHDKIDRGSGPPDIDDMNMYCEIAEGISSLWEATLPP